MGRNDGVELLLERQNFGGQRREFFARHGLAQFQLFCVNRFKVGGNTHEEKLPLPAGGVKLITLGTAGESRRQRAIGADAVEFLVGIAVKTDVVRSRIGRRIIIRERGGRQISGGLHGVKPCGLAGPDHDIVGRISGICAAGKLGDVQVVRRIGWAGPGLIFAGVRYAVTVSIGIGIHIRRAKIGQQPRDGQAVRCEHAFLDAIRLNIGHGVAQGNPAAVRAPDGTA